MNEESQFQGQPAYVERTSNKKRLVTIFFIVLLLLIAGLGALYLIGKSANHPIKPTNPVPTVTLATPTPASSTSAQLSVTPVATSSPTISLSSLDVSVLNGSGTVGAAGKVAAGLKSAGFTNTTTGNAKAYTYTGITVTVKDKANLPAVQKAVTAASPNAKVTASVDKTIPDDVEVIVGK